MRIMRGFACVSGLLVGAGIVMAQGTSQKGPAKPGMLLSTPAFADGTEIPPKYTMSVPAPVSPKLQWTNVPENTVSFALIFHDPDGAPRKRVDDYLHWIMFNIPGTVRELPEALAPGAQLPDGTIQAKNRGVNGYIGPGAPAVGPHHHYTFELFALDLKLDLGPDATRADLLKAIDGHILDKAVVVGRFHQ